MSLKRTLALSAVSLMLCTEVSMASSLLLPNPGQLAGDWQLYTEGDGTAPCRLQLQAPETKLGGDIECAARLIGERPSGWLVTPDTLAFVGNGGTTLVHFNRAAPNVYKWRTHDNKQLVLERITKA
ncbi:peptidase [Pseudomonas sp. SDI]|uniref:AprI/Inh family metalloprotease inhibitor n=1 Tax=Pseudomonas sp. SDI TaxID=2170734 RepID=UPI000DE6DA1C|nr:AprI/Inh family metalloprotease inhibitor [Pseudomonas sp. SDI]PWB35958.1 peptidase [Pseudomonas sp. SDI]